MANRLAGPRPKAVVWPRCQFPQKAIRSGWSFSPSAWAASCRAPPGGGATTYCPPFGGRWGGGAFGLQATMTYLGLTVGPSLGGWLAGRFGWQAVFTINLPVGALAFALSARAIPADPPPARPARVDPAGRL